MHFFRTLLLSTVLLLAAAAVDADQAQQASTDLNGDPLPSGAVRRLGTLRFRHLDTISFAAFLPDGKSVISVGEDGSISHWEFPSGKQILTFEAYPTKERLSARPGRIVSAALSADGKVIASCFSMPAIIPATQIIGGFALPGGLMPDKAPGPEGFLIRVHDVATGKEHKVDLKGERGAVTALAFSPDGKHLTAWCDDGAVRTWDWAGGKELHKVASIGGATPVASTPASKSLLQLLASPAGDSKNGVPIYSPNGQTIMLVGTARVLQFIDLASGKAIGPSLGHTASMTSLWFTPDGKTVLTQDGALVHRWDVASSKSLAEVKMPPSRSTGVVICPDGKIGVVADTAEFDPLIGLLKGGGIGGKAALKAKDMVFFDTGSGKGLGMTPLDAPGGTVLFSPNSKRLAISGAGGEARIAIYEVPSGKVLWTSDLLPGMTVAVKGGAFAALVRKGGVNYQHKMQFSADGKLLAFYAPGDGAALVILNAETGKQIGSITLKADCNVIAFGGFTPDGRGIAVDAVDDTSGERLVQLYELAAGQPRRTFASKSQEPARDQPLFRVEQLLLGAVKSPALLAKASIALSPDSKLLAIAEGNAVRLASVLTGKDLKVLQGHAAAVNGLAFAPDGKMLASASADTTALLWDLTKLEIPAAVGAGGKAGKADLDKWWQALAGGDASNAYDSILALIAAPDQAVALITAKVKPAAKVDRKVIEDLVFQLDDSKYPIREKANAELIKIGEPILPVLAVALAANPPPEIKSRLEDLRAKVTPGLFLQGERLRAYRAVEVLERIGTAQATDVLRALAAGEPGAHLTISAQAALKR
jgi:WD40 repeat protein